MNYTAEEVRAQADDMLGAYPALLRKPADMLNAYADSLDRRAEGGTDEVVGQAFDAAMGGSVRRPPLTVGAIRAALLAVWPVAAEPAQPADSGRAGDEAPIVQQLRGRAAFLRDKGRVKSPEVMERAADVLEAALAAQGQGEAVAWRWRDNVRPGLPWYLTDSADYAKQLRQSDMYTIEALYTHPASPAGVPDGMVLVPREPTPKMMEAGESALSDNGVDNPNISDAQVAYLAMLAAAQESQPNG